MDFALNPTIPTVPLVGIFIAFSVKHLLADYMLQTSYMVQGKEKLAGWAAPLALHAGMHSAATLLLVAAIEPAFWWLAPVDFVVHGLIDRTKSIIGRHGRWGPDDYHFWWLHGADQAAHHLTHFVFALMLSGAVSVG
jgi:hypothetical protein